MPYRSQTGAGKHYVGLLFQGEDRFMPSYWTVLLPELPEPSSSVTHLNWSPWHSAFANSSSSVAQRLACLGGRWDWLGAQPLA